MTNTNNFKKYSIFILITFILLTTNVSSSSNESIVKLRINDSPLLSVKDNVTYDYGNSVISAVISDTIVCYAPKLTNTKMPLPPILLEIKNLNGEVVYLNDAQGISGANYVINPNDSDYINPPASGEYKVFNIETSINTSCAIDNAIYNNNTNLIYKGGFERQRQGDVEVTILNMADQIIFSNFSGFIDNTETNKLSKSQANKYKIRVRNIGVDPLSIVLRDNYPDSTASITGFKKSSRNWSCSVTAIGSQGSLQIGETCGTGIENVNIPNALGSQELFFGDEITIITEQELGNSASAGDIIKVITSAFIVGENDEDLVPLNNSVTVPFKVTTNNVSQITGLNASYSFLEGGSINVGYNAPTQVSASSSDANIMLSSITPTGLAVSSSTDYYTDISSPVIVSISASSGETWTTENIEIEVIPVNDSPTFSLRGNIALNIDGDIYHDASIALNNPNQSHANFVRNVILESKNYSAIPVVDDGTQSLVGGYDISFALGNDGIFDIMPTIDSSGTLQYKLSNIASGGAAQFNVEVKDDGGIQNGGNDTTTKTFFITVQGKFAVGGMVSGLAGSGLVLQNNNGDDLPISANGSFVFSDLITDANNYNVTIASQPTAPSQTCSVVNGSGIISSSDVTNVQINCSTNEFTIGGSISGLASGSSVFLVNNSAGAAFSGTNFELSNAIVDGSNYVVTVLVQPTAPNQTCLVLNGTGVVSGANVTNIQVNCTTDTYSVSGSVSGLVGSITLSNNGADNIAITDSGLQSFTFTAQDDGSAYIITTTNSSTQSCTVSGGGVTNDGTGNLSGSDITNVIVTCQ